MIAWLDRGPPPPPPTNASSESCKFAALYNKDVERFGPALRRLGVVATVVGTLLLVIACFK